MIRTLSIIDKYFQMKTPHFGRIWHSVILKCIPTTQKGMVLILLLKIIKVKNITQIFYRIIELSNFKPTLHL